jgi:hypothetical protein
MRAVTAAGLLFLFWAAARAEEAKVILNDG